MTTVTPCCAARLKRMPSVVAMAIVCAAFNQQHGEWTKILKRYVHGGEVDYAGLKKSEGELDSYLRQLSAVQRDEFDRFNREDQLAFWINAYNAFLRGPADPRPLSSQQHPQHRTASESRFSLVIHPALRRQRLAERHRGRAALLRDRSKNRLEGSTLHVSSIFKWYRDDFVRASGSLEAYLAHYGLRGSRIEFLDYDWSLNGR